MKTEHYIVTTQIITEVHGKLNKWHIIIKKLYTVCLKKTGLLQLI